MPFEGRARSRHGEFWKRAHAFIAPLVPCLLDMRADAVCIEVWPVCASPQLGIIGHISCC